MAFMAMADIIAGDNSLIQRLRKDIADYNLGHEEDGEEDIASEVEPNLEIK
jgi:hypothetical protein